MLLGILFATSKQYSDKLSVDAKRGVDGNTKDGKYNGTIVPGYCIDPATKYFIPDGNNWTLFKNAFHMKLYEHKTDEDISKYLIANGFSKRRFENEEPIEVKVTSKWVNRNMKNSKDIIAQDEVCKKVVSNLYVKNNFVSVIYLNPPYDSMVDLTKISSGWG